MTMKRVLSVKRLLSLVTFTLALSGSLAPSPALAQQAAPSSTAVNRTLVPFLRALKGGNLGAMKSLLSAELAAHYRVLFEENREYAQYLRTFYRDTTFNIGTLTIGDQEALADIHLVWNDGRTGTVQIGLSRNANGAWKISRLSDHD